MDSEHGLRKNISVGQSMILTSVLRIEDVVCICVYMYAYV